MNEQQSSFTIPLNNFDVLARWCGAVSSLKPPFIHKDFVENPNLILFAIFFAQYLGVEPMEVITEWEDYRNSIIELTKEKE